MFRVIKTVIIHIYPIYEVCLSKFHHFQCNQQADRDEIIEKDDEGQEIQPKIISATIYWGRWEEKHL